MDAEMQSFHKKVLSPPKEQAQRKIQEYQRTALTVRDMGTNERSKSRRNSWQPGANLHSQYQ
jgi:hypothetical protein